MSDFYVNADDLNGLYNLFVRASGDARDTLDYTQKHCDMPAASEGYLMMLIGPHKSAYDNLTGALTQFSELAQGAGTQVNIAQGSYARSDHAAAARLDGGYPGARNAADLRGTLTRGRPDTHIQHTIFSDVTEPTARLRNPEYAVGIEMWSINPMADLISPAAWLRQISIWLFGHDPFEGWSKQFSGDWQAYVHCAVAMGAIGAAARDIGQNLVSGTQDVSTVWRGNAAEAEQEFQLALGNSLVALENACHQYNQLYNQAAEATKSLFDVVSGLISDLMDLLLIINLAAAAGTALIETGVGAVAGYGVAAYYTWQAYDLYKAISTFYGNAEDLIKVIGASISSVDAALQVRDLPSVQPYRHPAVG